jgi:hypothetical protein
MTQRLLDDPRIVYLIGVVKELGGATWHASDEYSTCYISFQCAKYGSYLYFDTRSDEIGRFSTGWQKLDFADDNQVRQIIKPLVKYER